MLLLPPGWDASHGRVYDPYRFRHVDDYSLKTNFARTTNFKHTYFKRIVEMWNSIPVDIRLSLSLATFKSGMKTFLMLL